MTTENPHIQPAASSFLSVRYMAFSIGLSLITMGLVMYFTWSPEGFEYIQLKRLPGLIIAFVVTLLKIYFQAWKYRILSDYTLSWMGAFRVVLTWDFASAITPSTIGGGPVAAYAMTREQIPLGKSGGIMLYGVLLDQLFYVMVIPILITMGFYYDVIPPNAGWVGTGAMFLIYTVLLGYSVILAYGLLVNPMSLKRMVRVLFGIPFLRGIRRKIVRESDNLIDFSDRLRKKPQGFLVKAFIVSTLNWLAKISLPSIVVLSFLPADVLLTFLRSFSMTFAGLFVPTPGGSGGAEALFLLFQGPLFERVIFIGISIFMWRLYTYYLSIGLGVFVMTWYMNPARQGVSE